MRKCLLLTPILFLAAVAEAQPVRTEFVSGTGFLRSSFGVSVEFAIEATQRGSDAPTGSVVAVFFSFPQHLFMTFESTGLESLAIDRRTALVTGTAQVHDSRSGFEGEIEFSAVFEDLDARSRRPRNDTMSLTLHLPEGPETFAGGIVPGGVEVGRTRQ